MIRGLWPACVTFVVFFATLSTAATAQSLADQLRARGIKDPRVLEAFAKVQRDAFMTSNISDQAPAGGSLASDRGQAISQPYAVARMTELLGPRPTDRVLEIGGGSGYHAAILAQLAQTVCLVETVPALAAAARLRLTRLGYRNVHVKQGEGAEGWREYGPYDRIVVTAAAPRVPRVLIDQLAEGGVLVMPIGAPRERQVLIRGIKRAGVLRAREIAEARLVPETRAGIREGARSKGGYAEPPRPEGDADEQADRERERPRDQIREESLPPEEVPGPKGERRGTDRRSRPDERDRVVGARGVPDGDHRCAVAGADLDAARSRIAERRCAG